MENHKEPSTHILALAATLLFVAISITFVVFVILD